MDKISANAIVEKVKGLVKKGNVSRIVVRKDSRELVNIPVNVGIVGGVVGLASAKWVLLLSVLATVGFGCSVEVIKDDDSVINVLDDTDTERLRTVVADAVDEVKDVVSDVKDSISSKDE